MKPMKRKPMTGTQAQMLADLAEQLSDYNDPQAQARAAGLRGRITSAPRISHKAAARLAVNAHTHVTALKEANK